MERKRQGGSSAPRLPRRLQELERQASEKGLHLHYERLETAGLKLRSGLCKVRGEYHIFIDRRTPPSERIALLETCLERPLPEHIPEFPDVPA